MRSKNYTRSLKIKDFHFHNLNKDHYLLSSRGIQVSPSAPIFLRFNMPADLDVALLKLTSEDERCMTLSVQNLTCPVYDLDTNVLFEGMWQVHIEIFT